TMSEDANDVPGEYPMSRTQIYLTARETEALDYLASATGRTRSQLIREAIDAHFHLATDADAIKRALDRSAGAWRGRRDDGAAYVERLRSGRLAARLGSR